MEHESDGKRPSTVVDDFADALSSTLLKGVNEKQLLASARECQHIVRSPRCHIHDSLYFLSAAIEMAPSPWYEGFGSEEKFKRTELARIKDNRIISSTVQSTGIGISKKSFTLAL